jgi:hypothetical protein
MSSQNLIQYFATGSTGPSIMNRVAIETFVPSGDFDAGDAVCFDTAKVDSERVVFVKAKLADNTNAKFFAGIAIDPSSITGSDGRRGARVAVGGYVEKANVATATVAGQYLVPSAVVGRLTGSDTVQTANNLPIVGVALENASSNTCDILVYQKCF